MMRRLPVILFLAVGVLASPAFAEAGDTHAADSKTKVGVRNEAISDSAVRLEGEKRFQANCGRCHQFPHKFPPRMMLTIERHMRVRSLVTEDDINLIIRYLNQ